jgi:hypothetical protein
LFDVLSVPPSIYPPEDEIHIVSAYQSQSLSCLVSGYPTPRIQWHRDGIHVNSDTHIRYGLRVSIEGFFYASWYITGRKHLHTSTPVKSYIYAHVQANTIVRKLCWMFCELKFTPMSSYYAEEGE